MLSLSKTARRNLFSLSKDLRKRVIWVLRMGIHESIVLRDILSNGSTTVRDLQPQMNCPYSAIRDVQRTYLIPLDWAKESRVKDVVRNGKVRKSSVNYRRYFIGTPEGISV